MIDLQKEIWEGWTVLDFIKEVQPELDMIMNGRSYIKPFRNKEEMSWHIVANQPYYKRKIPEVIDYFAEKYGLK